MNDAITVHFAQYPSNRGISAEALGRLGNAIASPASTLDEGRPLQPMIARVELGSLIVWIKLIVAEARERPLAAMAAVAEIWDLSGEAAKKFVGILLSTGMAYVAPPFTTAEREIVAALAVAATIPGHEMIHEEIRQGMSTLVDLAGASSAAGLSGLSTS